MGMSSLYEKNGKIYISWYDSLTGKTRNRTTQINATKRGWREAKQFQKEFDKQVEQLKSERKYRTKTEIAMSVSTIVESIKHFMELNQNKNQNTIKGYELFFNKFVEGSIFKMNNRVSSITKMKVEKWLIELKKRNPHYAQNTLFNYTKILKKYLKFLASYGYIQPIILNEDVVYRQETKQIETFTDEELEIMLERIKSKSPLIQRAFYLLLLTGLRPTDIIDLRKKDVDFENHKLHIYSQKTKEYRIVPFIPELVDYLQPLCEDLNADDKVLNYTNVKNMNRAINRFLKECNIKRKGINVRTFRKTFISKGYSSNIDYPTLAKIVGHKKISTTEKYYTYFDTKKQEQEIQKLSIVKKKKRNVQRA